MSALPKLGPATFIVGHPRSGTTLMRALLDGHPELSVLPFETHLFDWAGAADPTEAVLARTRMWPTLATHRPDLTRDDLEAALRHAFAGSRTVQERLEGLVRGWVDITGGDPARRWVEKTPRHLYELSTLSDWFGSDTRAIILQRDPRDVMASQLKQDASRSVFVMALTSRVAHEVVEAWATSDQAMTVSFEDLAHDASAVMGPVCDFLGITRHPAAFEPTVMGDPFGGNSRFQPSLDGVSTRPVGRYREVLSREQVRRIDALLGDQLVEQGYQVDRSGRRGRFVERLALDALVRLGAWRSRRIRRALRGG